MLRRGDRASASVFVRTSLVPADRNLESAYIDGGIGLKGLVPDRADDTPTIGVAYSTITADGRCIGQLHHRRGPGRVKALRGFYSSGESTKEKHPLPILNNGSDGSALDMWMLGAAGGTARGYDCLTFDAPGQGYALWKQGLYFRPDWERVITPVVDFALGRPGVDPKKIVPQGISQGGYWVPRAVAFKKRIAAAIADPGVIDVAISWTATLPPPVLQLLKPARKDEFDRFTAKTLDQAAKNSLIFCMCFYGVTSYYEPFRAAMDYNLTEVVGKIECPMLITEPANEAFWPGHSRRLFDLLTSPKAPFPFSAFDGADLHCEPAGFGLRDLRVFNWLDKPLGCRSMRAAATP